MKFLVLTLFLLFVQQSFAQSVFKVDNFSEKYSGEIYLTDTTEVFSKGWIAIIDKKSKKQIIRVNAEELYLSMHDGEALANIKELPYGEQSLIMYDDFNLDGVKDFAIEDGQNSCYHGPSFQIYLASGNEFKLNNDFTILAQEYCGMFYVDHEKKIITTMTKSGCCWHQYSEFKIENNKPKLVKLEEEDMSMFPFTNYYKEVWDGTKMVKTSRKTLNVEDDAVKIILSFKVDKKQKEIILFMYDNQSLNYALIDKNNNIEFSFPAETYSENEDFKYDKKNNTLTFQNKDAVYKIYSKDNSIGIEISVGGKTYDWIGNLESKKGDLKKLLSLKMENVLVE